MTRHQWKLSALKLMSFAPIAALGLLSLPSQAQTTTETASMSSEMSANLHSSFDQQYKSGGTSNFVEIRQGRLQILMATGLKQSEVCQSRCNTCQSRCNTCQSKPPQ
jgi:hypothetical protein